MLKIAICLSVVSLFSFGCETKEEKEKRIEGERSFALQHICIRRHGTAVLDNNGKFVKCEFSVRGIFKKE